MNNSAVPIKPLSWFGTTFWVVVGGLLLLNVACFIEYFDPLILQQILFRFNFRYWFPSLAYPLWLLFVFLAIDVMTLRKHHTNITKWHRRSGRVIFCFKFGFAIYIIYLFLSVLLTPYHKPALLFWFALNVPLFAFFLKQWLQIYITRTHTGLTQEAANVRKKFLLMSLTFVGELCILNFLLVTGLIRRFSYPLWYWFGFGAYSHWAVAAFVLICLAIGLTFFVLKEWLVAIRQASKNSKTTNPIQQSEVSHDT